MKIHLLSLLLISFFGHCLAQEQDSIKLAMKDELTRNMEQLKQEKLADPFYIGYTINDLKNTMVHASLGGILTSDQSHYRSLNVRVLVGDYEFNDESMRSQNVEPFYGPGDMSVPIEDDYFGIRRSLWSATDKIYRTAAEVFDEHKKQLEDDDEVITDIPHMKFAKREAIKISSSSSISVMSPEEIELKIKEISAIFLKYPEITASNVAYNGANGQTYFVNSEGSDVYFEKALATLAISAAYQDEDGIFIYDQYKYLNRDVNKIFEKTDFEKEIKKMVNGLNKQKTAQRLEDIYEGPVIFAGEAVPSIFNSTVFKFIPDPLKDEDDFSYGGARNTMESKLGKTTFSEMLTIRLTPSMTTYNSQFLLGSYPIDNEGIVPDEEVVLVKNGKVNDLMVGRNYSNEELKPNGTASGPGVIHIEVEETEKNFKSLKKQLIKLAQDEGMDYGFMVTDFSNQQLKIYKIYKDGREELYKGATIRDLDDKILRKIENSLAERIVHNNVLSNNNATYITPRAILVSDVEIEPVRMPSFKADVPLVESPLKAIQGNE